jgi:hypothetical protein
MINIKTDDTRITQRYFNKFTTLHNGLTTSPMDFTTTIRKTTFYDYAI